MEEDTRDLLSGIKIPNIVVGVLLYKKSGKILLAQVPRWNNKWVIVGGHVEYGEPLLECAKREVKEETGLEVNNLEFAKIEEAIFSKEFDEDRHFVFINYFAEVDDNSSPKPNYEITKFIWIEPKAALKLDLNESTRDMVFKFLETMSYGITNDAFR